MAPRFSVLLPTHDRADVIGFAISSVLAQTESDLELLVVGDGCTDDTAEIVGSFSDERVRWFELPKAPGFGYANRNLVLKQARGDLVAFMAHDDLLFPDHLERLGAVFDDARVEWAYSRPMWVFDDGLMIPFANDLRRVDHFAAFINGHNTIPASSIVHRRTCLDRYGYWDEGRRTSADHELWRRMVGPSGGQNLEYVPVCTALHFRADWRTAGTFGPPELKTWARTARADTSWPEALAIRIPGEVSPQARVWSELQGDADGWIGSVRAGVVAALDAMAWSLASGAPKIEAELAEVAERLIREGAPQTALTVTEAGLAGLPRSAPLLSARGTVLLHEGRIDEAIATLERAVTCDETLPYIHARLAQAYGTAGRLDDAIASYRRGLSARPDLAGRKGTAWLHAGLGRALRRRGDLEEAEVELTEALRCDPSLDPVAATLAEVRAELASDRSDR